MLAAKKGSIMKKLPALPKGYSWNVKTYHNRVLGEVTTLSIFQKVTKSFLRLPYQGKRLVTHSVFYVDDISWFDPEAKCMAEKVSKVP